MDNNFLLGCSEDWEFWTTSQGVPFILQIFRSGKPKILLSYIPTEISGFFLLMVNYLQLSRIRPIEFSQVGLLLVI